jgi:hypothetical protein
MQKDDMSNGHSTSSFIVPGLDEGPGTPPQAELCPVCLENGHEVPMIRGNATGYYWQYRCPRCGNLALIERVREEGPGGR